MKNKIDFVLAWVDGNDFEWRKERDIYSDNPSHKSAVRYRDWDILVYWFRAVEKYAPWVNRIHFVTWGHLPEWLNKDHPKLNIVNHKDYIPEDYLPTFSSHPIELNFHRIKGLEEKFVYFNDDMFITKEVSEEDFFKNGLPCDVAIPYPCSSTSRLGIGAIISNNMEIINTRFNKKESIRNNFLKWYNLKYGKFLVGAMTMAPYKCFTSFLTTHVAHSYLKDTFERVWELEEDILHKTCSHKFRNSSDVNQWLMRYWQIVEGNFSPRNINDTKLFTLGNRNEEALNAIENKKYKMICLNDHTDIKDFDGEKMLLQKAFEKNLGEKSSFEL